MARARKRHVQEAFRYLDKNGQRRGWRKGDPGARKAGRKPKGLRAMARHAKRPQLNGRFPVHVTLRVHEDTTNLRKRDMYNALREATIALARRELHENETGAFRIVHISIQHDHVHLIVEADNANALSRGMRAFQISAAKHINRAFSERAGLARRRRGSVFPDRYHAEIIKTPRQARHTLSYVLISNWRKHREDRKDRARGWNVDPFSTGVLFPDWKERLDEPFMWRWRETYDPLLVYRPRTWLLRKGWMKAGTISYSEVPSPRTA
jgi:REP element-mobilizing transposase RayT